MFPHMPSPLFPPKSLGQQQHSGPIAGISSSAASGMSSGGSFSPHQQQMNNLAAMLNPAAYSVAAHQQMNQMFANMAANMPSSASPGSFFPGKQILCKI
jgi:hypothetical protein